MSNLSHQHPNKMEVDYARDDCTKSRMQTRSSNRRQLCIPYPFQKYHSSRRYISERYFNIPESGPLNYIEPCHEYKAFINATGGKEMDKFIMEAIRFAAACMNSRTNGTIHFGIADDGQVLGVAVEDKEAYGNKLIWAIGLYFKHPKDAHSCIKPPRFVEVLNKNETSSDKYVIEVDIVPEDSICQNHFYFAKEVPPPGEKHKGPYRFYVRDGSSTKALYKLFNKSITDCKEKAVSRAELETLVTKNSQLRKQNAERQPSVIKSSTQGFRLSRMITGGFSSLDTSLLEYVIVTNKSHQSHFGSPSFLPVLKPIAVLDYDPESAECGLQHHCQSQMAVELFSPGQYVAERFLPKTSWILCNGGTENEAPSDLEQWSRNHGAFSQRFISSWENRNILIIFLLLSPVTERMHPLVYTFNAFRQELGTNRIISICDGDNAFISWKDLLQAECKIDVSDRCIYELSIAEVNGTILSLSSENNRAKRFLSCGGGSRVLLMKTMERSLNTLDVLCVNQCEGGNDNIEALEENFYRGRKVSWWNFYFLDKGESSVLIKRDIVKLITNCMVEARAQSKPCELFSLVHEPGCGGTTSAMHVLWELRDRFRCAVLKDRNVDISAVADQVHQLLTYGHDEQLPRVPVFLMIDDFDNKRKVLDLQEAIINRLEKHIKNTQVIILNCFRQTEPTEIDEHCFYIGNRLSDNEQIRFKKLLETEKIHSDAETFYAFMLSKTKLMPEYFKAVVHNTLRSFSKNQQESKLLAILALLTVNSKDASLHLSVCWAFLGQNTKPTDGANRLEDLTNFSNLICPATVNSDGQYKDLKMIHPNIAKYCLEELKTTHNMTIDDIATLLQDVADLSDGAEVKIKAKLQNVPSFRHPLSKLFHRPDTPRNN